MLLANDLEIPAHRIASVFYRLFLIFLLGVMCLAFAAGKPLYALPSPWAQDEIEQAIAAGLVPEDMQADYSMPITRAEFCRLLVMVLEKAAGTNIEEWMQTRFERTDFEFDVSPFSDTSDRNILAAYYLNIMQAKEDSLFDPDGHLTREEAAVSLTAAATYWIAANMPYRPDEQYTDFDEVDKSAQWAVAFLKRAGIMVGVGDNMFDPKGIFTREQAYLTLIRLWNCLPVPHNSA